MESSYFLCPHYNSLKLWFRISARATPMSRIEPILNQLFRRAVSIARWRTEAEHWSSNLNIIVCTRQNITPQSPQNVPRHLLRVPDLVKKAKYMYNEKISSGIIEFESYNNWAGGGDIMDKMNNYITKAVEKMLWTQTTILSAWIPHKLGQNRPNGGRNCCDWSKWAE